MNKMERINPSNCSNFPNNLHLGFHQSILAKLEEFESFTIEPKWTDYRDQYKSDISKLLDANKTSRKRASTTDQAACDAERDRIGSLLMFMISNGTNAADSATRQAALALDAVVNPYRGFQQESYLGETASIKGLLNDLRKPENATFVETLGIGSFMEQLEKENDRFESMTAAKANEHAEASQLPTTKMLRNRVDEHYQNMCDLIFAIGLLGATGSTDVEGAILLIQAINGIIKEYKTSFNMSQGQKKKDPAKPQESGEKEGEKQPEGGQEGGGGDGNLEFVPVGGNKTNE